MSESLTTEVVIVGGGTGGVAAALSALKLGAKVILSEETDWLGGQFSAQAVPPDEHAWIETMGSSKTYRQFRQAIRSYYKKHYPLTRKARAVKYFNPGYGFVSRLCHEPRVALAVIEGMLAPYRSSGQLQVFLNHKPVSVELEGDYVKAVTLECVKTQEQLCVSADWLLDATELGDLLELAEVEHVIGAESQQHTGELHASEVANPLDQQSFTSCFALEFLEAENHTIEKPDAYDFWRYYSVPFWPDRQFSWFDVNPVSLKKRHLGLFESELPNQGDLQRNLWTYRRAVAKEQFRKGFFESDISLVNWPQVGYHLGPLLGVPEAEKQRHIQAAKDLSLSFLYWMQTEAPRHDGGVGYPELRLRKDLLATKDGLAKSVYIRESRRIKAEFTILEEHVGVEQRGRLSTAEQFTDTVGLGSYRIDLHPSSAGRNYVDVSSYPFQLPLGSLIPVRVENLLPACKNIGSTHITNGCYRLHPVEWVIGEVAGALAAYSLKTKASARQIRNKAEKLAAFQNLLNKSLGIDLVWPEAIQKHKN